MPDDRDDDDDDDLDEGEGEDDSHEVEGDVITDENNQRLVRLPRRRPDPPTNSSGEPANVPPAPPDRRPRHRPAPPQTNLRSPEPSTRRRRRPAPPTTTHPEPAAIEPVNHSALPPAGPPPAPVIPAAPSPPVATAVNVFFTFEETVRLYPEAAQTISIERKSGIPANWMLTERPRTANELYAAMRKLHGRREETTYDVSFRDAAGHGSGGTVSMPSTMDDPPSTAAYSPQPPQPAYPAPYAPQPTSAAPQAPPAGPLEAMLVMQKQLFEMVNTLVPRASAQAPAPAPTAPLPPAPDVSSLLAMQKQMFEMIQAFQTSACAQTAPPAPQPQPAPAAPAQDPTSSVLAMQKQMFEMIQALQTPAGGHSPPAVPAPTQPPAQPDSMSAMLTMQKQMFDMMLTMMQTAQRGAAPSTSGPFLRPRYGDPQGTDPRDSRVPYQPPARPQTPSEQLRDAVSVVRSTFEVAREFGFGGAPAEPPEDDDSPVRVIDMGPAKGVINRSDGSLRGFETAMANLPDILKWVGEQRAEIRKSREEDRRQRQQRLPPGYVEVTPDYVPPEGFVAVPVDQIPPAAEDALPEPPAEMPLPIAQQPPATSKRAWGMPPTRPGA